MTESGGKRYINRSNKTITRGYVPVCALDYQTLRQRAAEDNSNDEIPRDFTHICQSGKRVFMIQGSALWVGEFDTMIFSDRIPLEYTVFRMEPLGDGVLIMADKGMYFVSEKLDVSRVISGDIMSHVVRYSVNGDGAVFGITDNDEVFACALVAQQGGTYIPVAKSISRGVLSDVKWGAEPQMHYCSGTLWISREHDIYGYRDGRWSRRHDFGSHTIRRLGDIAGKLVVFMRDDKMLFDVPTVDTTVETGVLE